MNRGVAKTAGANLHKLRTLHDLRQCDLATAIGVERSAVANWENGRYLPSESIIPKLMSLFRVNRDVVLGKKALKYELSNVKWTYYKPSRSGKYLAYVKYENGQREYLLLDYDHDEKRWEEKSVTYINTATGRRVDSYNRFTGQVLQWTSFPPSDFDIQEQVVRGKEQSR